MLIPEPRAKLESLKAEYTARTGATLLDKDVADIMTGDDRRRVYAPQVAQWFSESSRSSDIPPNRIGRLVAWLKEKEICIEIDWMRLSLAEFDARREAAGYRLVVDHPCRIFTSPIITVNFFEFVTKTGVEIAAIEPVGRVLGGGTPRDAYPVKPVFHFDPDEPPKYVERIPLRVDMPFDGRLTVVEADAVGNVWKFWCLDALLRIDDRKMGRTVWTLPYQGQGLPMNPPEGDCVLVGIATQGEERWLDLPWKNRPLEGEGARRVDSADLHDIGRQLRRRHAADYRVGLIEYAVAARR